MNYYIYILISDKRKNWSYVGQTDNLNKRVKEHNLGKVRSTKGMRPLRLVCFEKFDTREESLSRERYLKSGFGREEKESLISHSGIV